MAFRDLRAFVDHIEQMGQLRRIGVEVDPHLEITEIADRVMKADGPALLFENVKGSDVPLAINLLGTKQRMAWALGVDDWSELETRIERLLDLAMSPPPASIWGKLQTLGELVRVGRIGPRTVRGGPVQGHCRDGRPVAGRLAHSHLLAGGRRPLHHHAARLHSRSRQRQAQHGHVSAAGLRRADARHALAAAQGRRGALAPQRRGARPTRSGHCHRRRSGLAIRGHGALAAGYRRIGVCRLPAGCLGRDGARADGGHPGAGARGDRAGRLRGPAGVPDGRTLWGPYRLLLARRALPRVPPDSGDAAAGPNLRLHDRGASADGGRMDRQSHRAAVPAAGADGHSGNRRHEPARSTACSTTSPSCRFASVIRDRPAR